MLNVQRPFPQKLRLILLLYLFLTVGYSLINPLFETPDEHFHFFTINEIANNWQLPVIPETYDPYLGPEPAQPPLYYMLAALIVAPFDTAVAREQVPLNPFAWIGSAEAVVNLNRTIITPQELWPWQGYAIAAHLIRLFSTILGMGTVWLVYQSGRLLWPDDENISLMAAVLVAFLPQFNFIHSAVTNDVLITFLASLGIWQLLRLWQTAVSPKRLLMLGITIGLAALSKNAGILLLIYALGVLFLLAVRDLDTEQPFMAQLGHWLRITAVAILLPVLILAGWLWVRNQLLYGDFTAANQFVAIAGGDRQYTVRQVLAESGGLWLSFFAIFGWFNLRPPEWIYWLWNGIVTLSGIGFLWGGWRYFLNAKTVESGSLLQRVQRLLKMAWIPGALLFIWLLAVYAGLVTFMLQTEAAQGRLLFPAIVPISLGMAFGLSRLKQKWVYGVAGMAALATTVYCLFFVIRPAYALPKAVAELPKEATMLDAQMPFGLTLVGAQMETETAVLDDLVWVTLYWRLDEPLAEVPAFKFELIGRDLERPLGEIHTFHGRGLYPPTLWPVGELIADRFPVRIDDVRDLPVLAGGYARLPSLEEAANNIVEEGIFVGGVKIVPEQWPAVSTDVLAQLGDVIQLVEVALSETAVQRGDAVNINLIWQATGSPEQDYATLVHLGLPTESPLAQGDAHPRNGSYPTRLWRADEVIADDYQVVISTDLVLGCYPLLLGMYDPDTFERLPLSVNGQRQPHDVYQVDDICIEGS